MKLESFPHVSYDSLDAVVKEALGRNGQRSVNPDLDPMTRWLLQSGVEALTAIYMDDSKGLTQSDAVMDLRAPTAVDVLQAFTRIFEAHVGPAPRFTKEVLIVRWGNINAFRRDLIRFLYRPALSRFRVERVVSDLQARVPLLTLGDLVEKLAVSETLATINYPEMTLQVALPALFPSNAFIKAQAASTYFSRRRTWAAIYESIGSAYGFSIDSSSGYSMSDLATVLSVVVEGAWLRHVASVEAAILPTGERSIRVGELTLLEGGSHVSVVMVKAMLEHFTGHRWSHLQELRAETFLPP